MIDVHDLTFSYLHRPPVLKNISLHVDRGEVVNILGSNGCGKTTLLRSILGFLPTPRGSICVDGVPLQDISRQKLSHLLAYVPQQHKGIFAFTVMDIVLMGRTTHSPWLRFSVADRDKAMEALRRVRLLSLAERSYLELSGGQRQLVLIARALAQDCSCLIMDEPATGLDYGNQFHLLDLIGELAQSGPAIMLTTHHPEQALYLGGRAVLIQDGCVKADGPVADVITAQQVRELYDLPPRALHWMHLGEGESA